MVCNHNGWAEVSPNTRGAQPCIAGCGKYITLIPGDMQPGARRVTAASPTRTTGKIYVLTGMEFAYSEDTIEIAIRRMLDGMEHGDSAAVFVDSTIGGGPAGGYPMVTYVCQTVDAMAEVIRLHAGDDDSTMVEVAMEVQTVTFEA